jgi:intein/homing endonuclease
MKNVEILFEIEMDIQNFKNVKLEIEYSIGETKEELEFECVKISSENNFSENCIEEIEELLECGFYLDVVETLHNYYKNSNYTFLSN